MKASRKLHVIFMTNIQAVPLSARKAIGASTDGIAPFLQLPHFTDAVVEKIARKVFITLSIS